MAARGRIMLRAGSLTRSALPTQQPKVNQIVLTRTYADDKKKPDPAAAKQPAKPSPSPSPSTPSSSSSNTATDSPAADSFWGKIRKTLFDNKPAEDKPASAAKTATTAKTGPTTSPTAKASAAASNTSSSSSPSSSSTTEKKQEEQKPAGPYTKLVEIMSIIRDELIAPSADTSARYVPPADRRRGKEKQVEELPADNETKSVVIRNESKWEQQWTSFKENNPVINAFFGLRMKFDESNNILVRAARNVTDTVTERLGTVFEEGEMAQAMTEIHRIDPNFNMEIFTKYLQKKVIPSVLEAFLAGDIATLKDWCSEPCFNAMKEQINQRKQAGLYVESRIVDLRNVELLMGKEMELGPVLIFSFVVQHVLCVRDASGAVKEGKEDQVQRALYVLAMRRDQSNFHPFEAWQVLEMGMQASNDTW